MKTIRVRTKIDNMEDAQRRHIETLGRIVTEEGSFVIEHYPDHSNLRTSLFTFNLSELYELQVVIDSLADAGGHDDLVAALRKITADDDPVHIRE